MKDADPKPNHPLALKSKPNVKKTKMPIKKIKKEKEIKPKKTKKTALKKSEKKLKKERPGPKPKQKRGRAKKKVTVKNTKKTQIPGSKPKGRKRKIPLVPDIVIKQEIDDDFLLPPTPKKPKINNVVSTMNGNAKLPLPSIFSSYLNEDGHTSSNNIQCNGTAHGKRGHLTRKSTPPPVLPMFPIVPKKEVVNGDSFMRRNQMDKASNSKPDSIRPPKQTRTPKFSNQIVPYKPHSQRMASLDAMARMAVICISDRKPLEHHSKTTTSSVVTVCSQPFSNQKSITQCHERIEVKKESNNYVKQIKVVKEKQQVFVSNFGQHSSILEREEKSQTVSSKNLTDENSKKSQKLPVKKKCPKPNQKALTEAGPSGIKSKKPRANKKDKVNSSSPKTTKKTQRALKGNATEKRPSMRTNKKSKMIEQTKSEVKVKKTIRMKKTCTYQSVTTVNSTTSNSTTVGPMSHVDMTTNFSKTKKTVVTDDQSKDSLDYSENYSIESPPSVDHNHHHTNCCQFQPQTPISIIPFAHNQVCGLYGGMSSSDSSSMSHCDGFHGSNQHHHQQACLPMSSEYRCCCVGSTRNNIHNSCLTPTASTGCHYHHGPHYPHSTNSYSSRQCHQFGLPNSNARCCSCYEQDVTRHQQQASSCPQYMSSPSTPATASPAPKSSNNLDYAPLDLSISASSSNRISKSQWSYSPVMLQSRPFHQGYRYLNQPCCSGQHCSASALESRCPSVHLAPSTSGYNSKHVPITSNSIVPTVTGRQRGGSMKDGTFKVPAVPRKKHFSHGWCWKGTPVKKHVFFNNDATPFTRLCYPSIIHKEEGDIINERECVLLKSGAKETDLPYVAKVVAFFENPDDGEMMMSLLWYYRPEHTEKGRKVGQVDDEVYASRHKDVNSIACIEDKCYVLSFNEYSRYRSSLVLDQNTKSLASIMVPGIPEGYPRKNKIPGCTISGDMVFFCRHVYDFKQRRILKNPA